MTSSGIETLEAILRKLVNTAMTEEGIIAAGLVLGLVQTADAMVDDSVASEIADEDAERIKANFLARNAPIGPTPDDTDVGHGREGGA